MAQVRVMLLVVSWIFLVGGLSLDLVSCYWGIAFRLGVSQKRSGFFLVPLILYGIALAARGGRGLLFEYAFGDLLVLTCLHVLFQFGIPAAVGALASRERST